MKTNNIYKMIWSFIFISLLSIQSYAGGDVGNGGGGDAREDHTWTPTRLGRYFMDATTLSYLQTLAFYHSENPGHKIISCSDSKDALGFPELAEALKDKISFKIWVVPGAFKRFFGSKSKKRSWRLNRLCENEKHVEAYGHLVMTLNDMLKADEVGTYLLNTVAQKGSPVTFVISDQREKIKAKGGEIEEFTWFDHETGEIFWAPRVEQRGMILLVGRRPEAFLRHELMHALIYRSLPQYPKVDYWHDVSEITKGHPEGRFLIDPELDLTQPNKKRYPYFKTSPEAAFIEGLAFAMERGMYIEHPRIVMTDFNRLWFRKELNQYEYGKDYILQMRDGRAVVPIESEVYLATALSHLFIDYKPAEDQMIHIENEQSFLYLMTNGQMMKDVIDVISSTGPSNVVDFARNLDERLGLDIDIGNRWLREFFFQDYASSKNILDYFEKSEKPKTEYGRSHLYLDPSHRDLFFSPYLEDVENFEQKVAEERLGQKYDPLTLSNQISKILEKEDLRLEDVEKKVMTLAEAAAKRTKLQDHFSSFTPDFYFAYTVQRDIATKYTKLIYPHDIWASIVIYGVEIEDYMDNQKMLPAFLQAEIDKHQHIIDGLISLKNQQTTVGTREHINRVLSVREVVKALKENTETLIHYILLTDFFTEYFES